MQKRRFRLRWDSSPGLVNRQSKDTFEESKFKTILAKQTFTAGLGALLHEKNHGCRRASAFTYLLLIWIGLFKLRLSVSVKNAFVVVKYALRVRTGTAFTSKVLSFPVLRWEFYFYAYIYSCTYHLLFMLTIYLLVKQLINYCITLWEPGFCIVYTMLREAQR